MRIRDFLALALIAVLAIGGKMFGDGGDGPPSRRPDPRLFEPPSADVIAPGEGVGSRPQTPGGAPLPRESPFDPRFIVEVGNKQKNSTGTAFSINGNGVWITARHVTDGCRTVAIRIPGGQLVRTRRVEITRHADISLLWTRGGAPAMPIVNPNLRIGEDGFSFGYPGGRAGDVHARLIGRGKMLSRGRYRTDEPVIAWNQITRIPDRGSDLSGISGGPWVDAHGNVIGVHVAGAPRRGRSYATAPDSLIRAISNAKVAPVPEPAHLPDKSKLTSHRFHQYGDDLRRQLTVAQVVCLAN